MTLSRVFICSLKKDSKADRMKPPRKDPGLPHLHNRGFPASPLRLKKNGVMWGLT